MDNEMIKRCAKALVNSIKENDFSDHDLYMMGEEGYIAVDQILVKAVIKAMREPTEKMLNIDGPDMPAGGSVVEVWQSVIDAVIND